MASPASKWRGDKCNNLGDPQTMKLSLLEPTQPDRGVKMSFVQGDICRRQSDDGQTIMGARSITFEERADHQRHH